MYYVLNYVFVSVSEDAINSLAFFTAELFAKHDPASLKWVYATKGDVLYVPFGTLVVERAVGDKHSVCLRTTSMMFTPQLQQASLFYASAYPQTLGLGSAVSSAP